MFNWLKGLVSKDLLIELTEAKIRIKSFGDKNCVEFEPVLALIDEPRLRRGSRALVVRLLKCQAGTFALLILFPILGCL